MKDFLKKKGLLITACALLAAVLLGVASFVLGGKEGFLSSALSAAAQPFGRGAAAVAGFFEDIYGYMFKYDELEAENELLRRRIAELEDASRRSEAALEENARLRGLLELRLSHADFDFESASVVSLGVSNWGRTITIGKGSSSGIELLDCVVTETGALVGQVSELGASSAVVRLVTDPAFSAGAKLAGSGDTGIATGYFTLMREGKLRLSYLPDGASLATGDTVLTSGKGETMPGGLVIGTVTGAGLDSSGSVCAELTPAADLGRLTQVFVIKSFDIVE